ncbi:nitroreductase family protein [Nitrospira lenta]|uniref:Nitroreductase n=1 Tax=Nitrospira lenta TaxID=1436998 RepID=A0A330L6E3_9BACT|nr:nitroreductase family protein [Nitrospira lenta]SPP64505.1 Nitroreductase [Nitrospira lenta]
MEKPAETQVPIHDLLRRRWSPRAFAERPVEPNAVLSLLEAARWAPSSSNEQPCRFIVATKDQPIEYARLLACLMDGNRVWAYRAPVLILSVACMEFEEDGSLNRHAFHDVGLATENLLLQVTALGLVAHPMAGFDIEKARADLQIPPGYEPAAMIAVGYPGELSVLPDHLQQRELKPRERKPLTEIAFLGQWGHPFPFPSPQM